MPEVALIQIFGHLPLHDQLTARRVNKYWQLLIDRYVRREKELILFIRIYPRPTYWKHDQREANPANALRVNLKLLLESDFFWSYFQKTRKLIVAHGENAQCSALLERIQASFIDLQHLQFNSGDHYHFYGPTEAPTIELCLPNLRTFYAVASDVPFNLNCPQLSELSVGNWLTIDETTNDQTLLCLKRLRLLRVFGLQNRLGFRFSNLEILICPNGFVFLDHFPVLKELHYLLSYCAGPVDGIAERVQTILNEKEALRRDQLKIYLHGFDLNVKTVRDIWTIYDRENLDVFTFRINANVLRVLKENASGFNFNLHGKALWLDDSVDAELLESKLPKSLVQSIEQLGIGNLSEASLNFFEIPCRFPYIYSVYVWSELAQQQLDLLPDALPHLLGFWYRPKLLQRYPPNFEFLSRFKSLDWFTMHNHNLSIDELRLILLHCKVLRSFSFVKLASKYLLCIDMPKEPKGAYHLEWRERSQTEGSRVFARATFDHEELFSYLEASKWIQKLDPSQGSS